MSRYLDLETYRWHDEEEARDRVEWMTIGLDREAVTIGREDLACDGTRRRDHDAGVTFNARHLDAVIDALTRIRADLGRASPAHGKPQEGT